MDLTKIIKRKDSNSILTINEIGIPKIIYSEYIILRKIADGNLWITKIIFIPLSVFAISTLQLLKIDNIKYSIIFVLLGNLIGFVFQYDDIIKLFKILFGKKNSFYVKFKGEGIELIVNESVKGSHKDVYFYEEAFKEYTMDDLKRELIINEQDIENTNKKGFWDNYIVPIIFIMTTSMIGFYNGLWINLSNTDGIDIIIRYQFITMITVAYIMLQIIWLKHMFSIPKNNLKLINLVLKDLIEKKSYENLN
jgi:hypothetical protein